MRTTFAKTCVACRALPGNKKCPVCLSASRAKRQRNCRDCGILPRHGEHVRCRECHDTHLARSRRKPVVRRADVYKHRRASGLCTDCGGPAMDGRARCMSCADHKNETRESRRGKALGPSVAPLTRKQREARGIVLTPPMLIGSKKRPLSRGEHVRACAGPQDGRDVVSARPRPRPATFERREPGSVVLL